MNDLNTKLNTVRSRVAQACEMAGRSIEEVQILAVSKRHPAAAISALHALGMKAFGENYVQEAVGKMEQLQPLDIEWHFIGPLQSNKTREVAARFHWVHSVDREKVLRRLSAQRPAGMRPLNLCIQVNIDREPQKSGILPEQAASLVELALSLPAIHLRGLMTIPQAASDGHDPTDSYRRMTMLFAKLNKLTPGGAGMDTLSMGMSGDLEAAIHNGSTMVRIGTDLFGPRES